MTSLFSLFDAKSEVKSSGYLGKEDIICGLGIICKGTIGERLRLSFDLFDYKRNGVLERAEIFRGFKFSLLDALELEKLSKEEEETKAKRVGSDGETVD